MELFEKKVEHRFDGLRYIVSMGGGLCNPFPRMWDAVCYTSMDVSVCHYCVLFMVFVIIMSLVWLMEPCCLKVQMIAAVLLFTRKLYISISKLLNLLWRNPAIINRKLPDIPLLRIYKLILVKGILFTLLGRACVVLGEHIRSFRGYFRASFLGENVFRKDDKCYPDPHPHPKRMQQEHYRKKEKKGNQTKTKNPKKTKQKHKKKKKKKKKKQRK